MQKVTINLTINGQEKNFEILPSLSLADLLSQKNYRGIRRACNEGNCGGCTVLLDKKPVVSCLMHAIQAQGKEILTLDGILNYNEDLNKIPECFLRSGSSQCGFCTAGIIMALAGIYFKNCDPDVDMLKRGLSGNLCRCTGYEGILRGARLFFDVVNKRKTIEDRKLSYPYVGKPLNKVDGKILTEAIPQYVSDMNLENQLYLCVKGARIAHGEIESINFDKIKNIPGIIKIYTYENVPDVLFTSAAQGYPEPSPYDQKLLDKIVRFHGEPVVAIIAESYEIAFKACEEIEIVYKEKPLEINAVNSVNNTKSVIHNKPDLNNIEDYSKNLVHSFDFSSDDFCFPDDSIIVEGHFETSKQQHMHLERHISLSYISSDGMLVIYSSTQVPFDIRRIVSKITGIPFSGIRVIKPRIGGGFGGKQEMLTEALSALGAWETQRPVKYEMSRKEEFTYARTRHPFDIKIKAGFNKSGVFKHLEADIVSDTGAYGGHGSTVAELATMRITQMYRNIKYKVNTKVAYTNKTPAGAFRGYGEPQITFALESIMDMAGEKLGISPDKIREINHVRPKDSLTVNTLFVKPYTKGETIEHCPFEELIKKGKEKIDWNNRRAGSKNIKTGKGMAISFQGSGIPNITRASAIATLNEDGSVQIQAGAVDIGTGSDTVLTQIACDSCGVSPDKIRLVTADTLLTPYDSGAYASNTTYYSGNAVYEACLKMKNAVKKWVSEKWKISEDQIEVSENFVIAKDKKESLSIVASGMYSDINPVETSFYSVVKRSDHALPFVVTFADIDVDVKTGKIRIEKIHHQLDCGTVINPILAKGQVEGTTVQAIGFALYEELSYNSLGQIREKDLLTYKIPTIYEKPVIEVEFNDSYEKTGPFGAKALGELAFSTIAPAIANALYDAVKVRITTLPIQPWKVLTELKGE